MSAEDKQKKPKIGAGHLSAMGRAGLKEAGQALVALPSSTIRPVEEPGIAGNLTQAEVAQSRGSAYDSMLKKYDSRKWEELPEPQIEQ